MKNISSLLLLVLLASCSAPPKQNDLNDDSLSEIIEEFDKQLAKDAEDDNINGSISAAIVKEDRIIWSKAYGLSDLDHNIPADTSTIYRTGSISKSITAFLMMQLVEDGIISLDDPIDEYLPEIEDLSGYSDSTRITFKELASHTSGLIREPGLADAAKGPIDEWENKILLSIPETRFQSRPGERYSYSNIGFGILGLTLQRAANKPFMELVSNKIFGPLNMDNSFFIIPDEESARLAKGMAGGPIGDLDKETPAAEHAGRGYKVPNGGIYSTPNDLCKFIIANMGYLEILTEDSRNQMHMRQTPDESFQSYGLGFSLYQDNTINAVSHGGSVAGYTCYLMFDNNSHFGVVIMRNYNFGITNLNLRSIILLRKLSEIL